jgi:hypothetical protein
MCAPNIAAKGVLASGGLKRKIQKTAAPIAVIPCRVSCVISHVTAAND